MFPWENSLAAAGTEHEAVRCRVVPLTTVREMGAERSPNSNATRELHCFVLDATVELDASTLLLPEAQTPRGVKEKISRSDAFSSSSSSSIKNRQFSNYLTTASVANPYNEAVFALREEDTYPLLGA